MTFRRFRGIRFGWVLVLGAGLSGCATLPERLPPGPASQALAPKSAGALAALENRIKPKLAGADSAYRLLDSNEDALRWRLAAIDSAELSIDIQTYFWWSDATGSLLARHIVMAADRGVRVRILVDDLSTMLDGKGMPKVRDWEAALLNAHPKIEVRLFNPSRARSVPGRVLQFITRLQRMNQRMHHKAIIIDNRAAIFGGRNIGDEYFGYSGEFNFRDLDAMGLGEVARHASATFDRYWNSQWVAPVAALELDAKTKDLRAARPAALKVIQASSVLERFPLDRHDWGDLWRRFEAEAPLGVDRFLTDVPSGDQVRHRMPGAIRQLMSGAKRELLIVNAYVIPEDDDIALFRELTARGVKVRLLTNSLASQDVPAVNSHYKKWRKRIVESGVELYECRPDAAIQSLVADTAPNKAGFMGLHVKAIVVDGVRSFIGSMNLDPRSEDLNTEMGVSIDSAPLAAQLTAIMNRDMRPENAWRVTVTDRGGLRWTAGEQVLSRQPARSGWQRVQDMIFMLFPRNLY